MTPAETAGSLSPAERKVLLQAVADVRKTRDRIRRAQKSGRPVAVPDFDNVVVFPDRRVSLERLMVPGAKCLAWSRSYDHAVYVTDFGRAVAEELEAMPRKKNPKISRAENPIPVLLAGAAFGVGIVCGAAVTFFRIGGSTLEYGEYVELEDIEGAILLFGHDGSLVDEVIDVYSNRQGICHAALHVGLTDNEGNPMLIESLPRTGVHLRSPDDYKEREVIVVPMSPDDTAYARQAALAHLHRRTSYRGRPGGLTCSEFVVACLPPRLRKRFPRDRLVTPVDLAMGLVEDKSAKQLKNKLLK